MKLLLKIFVFCIILFLPLVSAEICENQEIHECRDVSGKIHAFNGRLYTECVERGVYEICTAFDHLGVEGSCSINENETAVCSCITDVSLFCSTDSLAIVKSNADCTTRNELCTGGLFCNENIEAPFNPVCGNIPPENLNDGSDGSSGGSYSGSGGSSGADDFPTTDEDRERNNEPTGTITDIIEDFTEDLSNPESPTLMIVIIIVIIVAIASIIYYFKKYRKHVYKGY